MKLLILTLLCAVLAFAQGTTATLDGTVKDPQGATIPAAQVKVTNVATGQVFETTSDERGHWALPSMSAGNYRVAVSKDGFSTKTIDGVAMNAGVPATVNIALELGQVTQTVEVSAGAEIVQVTSATVSNTITGRQVVELPYYSRNATELITMMPGASSPGAPRYATVNGLPQGSLNVTIDGLNTQDNLLKSSNGAYSYIMPSTDSLEEVTMSSGAGSVDATAQGAAQMKYVTKSGSNSFHGGVFWQNRNTALEANYYFSNQNGNPRAIINLNQGGFHVGGPVKKDKLFFFVNYEIFRLPQSAAASRTFLTDSAISGNYTYMGTDKALHTANLFQLAAAANANLPAGTRAFPATADPTLQKTFQTISQLANGGGGTVLPNIANNNDYNRLTLNYMPSGMQKRRFVTSRIDYNITPNETFSIVWNHNRYDSVYDVLNGVTPVLPGTGAVLGSDAAGGQVGQRFDGVASLRSTLSPRLTNEIRAGLMGGITAWNSQVSPTAFANWKGYYPYFCSGAGSCSTSYMSSISTVTNPQRRNSPVKNITDNVSWVKGKHQLMFGGSFDQASLFNQMMGTESIPYIYLGSAAGDPLVTGTTAAFANTTVMPGSSSTDWTSAASLYTALTGRVYQISTQNVLDEKAKQYAKNPFIERDHIREFGVFVQDTWRVTPTLTLSGGLRWEKQMPFVNTNQLYSATTPDSIWGVSGIGNLFRPGYTPNTAAPTFVSLDSVDAYKIPAVWAPSAGIAWQLPAHEGFLGKLLGNHTGATVLRMGYSIATVREGLNVFSSIYGSNVGMTQDASLSPTTFPADFGPAGSVMFSDPTLPARSGLLTSPQYPITARATDSLNGFDPNLKMGYVQSWNIGLQRELGQNTVVEVRYTGNHALKLWRQVNLNEINTVENGFLSEFQIAQQNLMVARQNQASCSAAGRWNCTNNFGNQGLPGQRNIPILTTALNGATNDVAMAGYMLFPGSLVPYGQVGSAASRIATTATYMNRLVAAGYPKNMFMVNPDVYSGGTWLITNWGASYYDALQVEVRRRLSKGLMVQSSYEFGKSLKNGSGGTTTNDGIVYSQPFTLRNLGLSKMPSGFDLRHQVKVNFIYELPFGPGRRFLRVSNPVAKKALEGWEIAAVTRLQSGAPFQLSNGTTTFNTQAGGIVLHNITPDQLQQMIGITKTSQFVTNAAGAYQLGADGNPKAQGILYYLPADFINNTKSAWNVVTPMLDSNYKPIVVNGEKQMTGINQLDPTKPYIGPAATGTQGWLDFYLRMPWMQFWNFSVVKRTTITERVNMELRAQALNAFNRTNFNGFSGVGSSLGQVTGAYSDSSGTFDPGARVFEFVLRLNF